MRIQILLTLTMALSMALTMGLTDVRSENAATDASGDVVAGEKRYLVNCVNCHGTTGKGLASFPPIKGRDAHYISDRLIKYRARENVGPNSAIMMSLTSELTDEEITNLAAYISATFQ